MRILVGEEDSFYEALVAHMHGYQIILISGSKLNFIYDEK